MSILQDSLPEGSSNRQAEIDSLRQLINTTLILLVLLSGTLTMYLFYQYKVVHQEVEIIRPQYSDALAQFEQMRPKLEDFEKRISAFANAHQDFAQIISKYAPRRPGTAAPGGKK